MASSIGGERSSLRRLVSARNRASKKVVATSHDEAWTPAASVPAMARTTKPAAITVTSSKATRLAKAV